MNAPRQRDDFYSRIFGFSDESVEVRLRWRLILGTLAWILLSGFATVLTIFIPATLPHKLITLFLNFIKYPAVIWVAYSLAKESASRYLNDIFELEDDTIAEDFIEEVTFGYGHDSITINEGKISEIDEHSPIILIGGPGQIQVNLGSAALLERVDGQPKVIYSREEPWQLGRFERIREIGKQDEISKREYAVINLRDQFAHGIAVKARTKDGITIEALDIKIMFSILRPDSKNRKSAEEKLAYPFKEQAMHSIVYGQTTITPTPISPGVSFPWDTTVIPLVSTELERLISSHTLSDLLASIGQKELQSMYDNEQTVAQMRSEMTGTQPAAHKVGETPKRNREEKNIANKFLSPEFHNKAAALGVSIQWIDVGRWNIASKIVDDKLKSGWELIQKNANRKKNLDNLTKKYQNDELVELIDNVVINNFESDSNPFNFSEKELQYLRDIKVLLANDPSFNLNSHLERLINPEGAKREPFDIASDMLSAFRAELIAARDLILKENKPENEIQGEIAKIDKVLRDIAEHLPYDIK